MYLRNAWYVAMWAKNLGTDVIESRQILGEPIALYRKRDGGIAALLDVCPHRFSAFSGLGKILPGDRIQCPYHGLQFDSDGRCVHNPHGAGNTPSSAAVKTYPAYEQDAIIWIWMGDTKLANSDDIPRYPLLADSPPELISKRDHLVMDANYILIIENLLDLSHASILHDGVLGNEETIFAEIDVSEDGDELMVARLNRDVPVPGMHDLMFRRNGGQVDMWTDITWRAPGCLRNDTGVTDVGGTREDGTGIFGHHFLTPIDETTTSYHFCAVRQNPIELEADTETEVRNKISDLRHMAFEEQDGVVIAAQQKRMLNSAIDTSRPILLNIDDAPMRFRRILDRLIANEQPASDAM